MIKRELTLAKIRTIHYGLGSIGVEAVRLAMMRDDFEVVAAIDTHPARAGKDLATILGLEDSPGVTVTYDPESVLRHAAADLVLHSTSASLTSAFPELMQITAAGKNVISNCPGLAFPWVHYPEIAQKLDQQARQAGTCILAAGVGPGFIADIIPMLLTLACQQVKSLRIRRVVNVADRLLEMREQTGIGLSQEGFKRAVDSGLIGLTGGRESAALLADTLGWRIDDLRETLEPFVADDRIKTDDLAVDKGYVSGLKQRTIGLVGGNEVIAIEMETRLEPADPKDEIIIDGQPPLHMVIPGGIKTEAASAALMINCAPAVVRGQHRGLVSMRDLPIAPYRETTTESRLQAGGSTDPQAGINV